MKMCAKIALPDLALALMLALAPDLTLPLLSPAFGPSPAFGLAYAESESAGFASPQVSGGNVSPLVPLKAGPGMGVWQDSRTGDVFIRGNLPGHGNGPDHVPDQKSRVRQDPAGEARGERRSPRP